MRSRIGCHQDFSRMPDIIPFPREATLEHNIPVAVALEAVWGWCLNSEPKGSAIFIAYSQSLNAAFTLGAELEMR